jgi:uncharacterized protein (DUF2236 family)
MRQASVLDTARAVTGLDLPPMEPGRPGDPGLFGPESRVWTVARERTLLTGGPAALLLQIAHPLVAAGVAGHSGFREDPFRRLRATLDATLRVSFGDREQAEAAAARVRLTHRRIRGTLPAATGRYPAGTPYDASDPDLALWVHATLIWTSLRVYGRFVRPLSAAECDRHYQETKPFALLFGVDADRMPSSWTAFEGYVERTLARDVAVGSTASALAATILRPPLPLVLGFGPPVARRVTAGLLPPRLREAFGLPWGRVERAAATSVAATSRATVRRLPPGLRFWPHYRVALRRVGSGTPDDRQGIATATRRSRSPRRCGSHGECAVAPQLGFGRGCPPVC